MSGLVAVRRIGLAAADFEVIIKGEFADSQKFADLFPGFCDEESALLVEKTDKFDLLVFVHLQGRLSDLFLSHLNQMAENIVYIGSENLLVVGCKVIKLVELA